MTQTSSTPQARYAVRQQATRRIERALRTYADTAELPLTVVQVHELARTAARALDVPELEIATTDRVLTGRQYDVLLGVMCGESVEETADRLIITGHTVRTMRKLLYARLGVHSGGAAVAVAIASGLVRVMPEQVAQAARRVAPEQDAGASTLKLRALLARQGRAE